VSIRQRLYPTPEQEQVLKNHAGQVRFVYNLANEGYMTTQNLKTNGHPDVTFPTYNKQATRGLKELRETYPWLKEGPSALQQDAIADCNKAWLNHWEDPDTYVLPNYKKKNHKEGFNIRLGKNALTKLNKKWATVYIPKLGPIKFRPTVPWNKIKEASSARVTLRNYQWHISFTTLPKETTREMTGNAVGIDRNSKKDKTNTLVTSDGDFYGIPTFTREEQNRLNYLQKQLNRQKKGSKNRERTKKKTSKLHLTLRNRRKDWIEKTTTELVRKYDILILEDLNIKNMMTAPKPVEEPNNPGQFLPNGSAAKAGLNKGIAESCWGMFARRLEQKSNYCGNTSYYGVVQPHYTSQQCFECTNTDKDNRKSQAGFLCLKCGYKNNADVNAANNILVKGFNQLFSLLSVIEDSGIINNLMYAAGQVVNGAGGQRDTGLTGTRYSKHYELWETLLDLISKSSTTLPTPKEHLTNS